MFGQALSFFLFSLNKHHLPQKFQDFVPILYHDWGVIVHLNSMSH